MKKILWILGFLLLASMPLLAQDPTPGPVIAIPDPIIKIVVAIFAAGAIIYKAIDGLKNFIPGLAGNATLLRILNFVGNLLILGGGCVVLGHVHDLFDVLKCLGAAVSASLVAAGFYQAKRESDLARAGGASNLTNTKAVAEVANGNEKKY